MNNRKARFAPSTLLVAIFVLGMGGPVEAQSTVDIVGDGVILFEEGLDEELLLNVDRIVVFGPGFDVDDNSMYIAPCGSGSTTAVPLRPVEVILIAHGGPVAFATLWAVFPDTLAGPRGVWAVVDSRVESFRWWFSPLNPGDCFDAVAFDLVSLDPNPLN